MSSAVLPSSAKRAATLGSEARELSASNCPRRISLIYAAFLLMNGCPFDLPITKRPPASNSMDGRRGRTVSCVSATCHAFGRRCRCAALGSPVEPRHRLSPSAKPSFRTGQAKPVRVLILIDQDVIEPTPDVVGKDWIAHGLRPVQQQIVVIEHILALLGFDIGRKQILQFRSPSGAPRERRSQHLFDRSLCVDAPRVDRNAGSLGREAARGFRETL